MKRYAASSDAADSALPLVALVGRPNVGKSSLFNRLVGGRPALVEDQPGVTRDRRYGTVTWLTSRFRVVDTGGLDPSAQGILGAMRAQTLRAVDEADLLLFVVDGAEGITAVDEETAALLRRTAKPVFVVANKIDSTKREANVGEVHQLGFPDVLAVSAEHGRGVGDLLDAVVARLAIAVDDALERPDGDDGEEEGAEMPGQGTANTDAPDATDAAAARPLRLAFVGRPNVGKSSLVNRLLGEERVLVHDQPGTTRDPIDTPFSFAGREFVLVDTAGLRRRRALVTQTEAVADKMARDQLARCDVAALVIDGEAGAGAEDAKIAGLIEEAGRATLIVLNKRDKVPRASVDQRIEGVRETLRFLPWAPVVLTSARTGAGVTDVPAMADRVFAESSRRVSTGELNRLLEAIVGEKPPPAGPSGRHVRLYFATQAEVRPPTFVISANYPAAVPFSYRRFLANQFRRAYGFEGTPIRVVLRERRRKRRGPGPSE